MAREAATSVSLTQTLANRRNWQSQGGVWSANMDRWLTVYSNEDDSFVTQYRLHNIGIDVMQHLWNRPPDDPMPAMYPVEEWMLPTLRRYMDTDIAFDAQRFSYSIFAVLGDKLRHDGLAW
jgi:hypothetical protein